MSAPKYLEEMNTYNKKIYDLHNRVEYGVFFFFVFVIAYAVLVFMHLGISVILDFILLTITTIFLISTQCAINKLKRNQHSKS